MSLKFQPNFTTGELDPALQERVDLARYAAGLNTLRNSIIGKTGRILSRPARKQIAQCKTDGRKVRLHAFGENGTFLEWGHQYVRLYHADGSFGVELAHALTEDDLDNIVFVNISEIEVLIIGVGNVLRLLNLGDLSTIADYDFTLPDPGSLALTTATGTGYALDYLVTRIVNGVESVVVEYADGLLPSGGVEVNIIESYVDFQADGDVTELKVYRRPRGAGAYGFIGSSTSFTQNTLANTYAPAAVNIGTDTIVFGVHGLPHLAKVQVTTAGTLPGGLALATDYWIIRVDSGNYKYASSYENAIAGIPVDLTSTGSVTNTTTLEYDYLITFNDYGGDAEFLHGPPTPLSTMRDNGYTTPNSLNPEGGVLYQQRLLLNHADRVSMSRTGYLSNFYRDYPLADDSAMSLKMGSSGFSGILHMIDGDGLLVFTTRGVFQHTGSLSTTNLALNKRGNWVISRTVPPLPIPGGVIFIEESTNTVRLMKWSEEGVTMVAEELSIFSNHLFQGKLVVDWAFQEGEFPLLWVVFNDGSYASLTYEREHKMKSWARHDSGLDAERVIYLRPNSANTPGQIFMVFKNGDERHIEAIVPRYVSASITAADSESDKNESIAALDSMVSWSHLVNDDKTTEANVLTVELIEPTFVDGDVTVGTDNINITGHQLTDLAVIQLTTTGVLPTGLSLLTNYYVIYVDANNIKLAASRADAIADAAVDITAAAGGGTHTVSTTWVGLGPLTITSDIDNIFLVAGMGTVGTIFRYFDSDKASYDLTVLSRTSDTEVVVSSNIEFPSADAVDPRLYEAKAVFTGLGHMDGENVSIVSDGYVLASPNNDVEGYTDVSPSSGSLTLPDSLTGAFVHIGRPFTADVETLDVNTVEQTPVLIESMTINKLYISIHKTRGFYYSYGFPITDSILEMEDIDAHDVDYVKANPITANKYNDPRSKRLELSMKGDWNSQGKIAVRNVDPLHFEILSFYPDIEYLKRLNRR